METDEYYKNLSNNIKSERKKSGSTQDKLAEMIGMSLNHLGKIEVNFSRPSLEIIFKLAIALNISPTKFFE